MNLIAFLTNQRGWRIWSVVCKWILESIYNVSVGKHFYCEGVPRLRLRGAPINISIGDDVKILGPIDLRTREAGAIRIGNNVTVERECRFVSARDGIINIGNDTVIGAYAIWNGGADIAIGEKCLFGVRSSINSNDHKVGRQVPIRDQGFVHAAITIEEDCWFGANVSINKGCLIKKGSVVAANAVVTKDTDQYSINAGVPASKIGERS